MKSKIVFPFLILVLASMACGFNIELPKAQKPGPEGRALVIELDEMWHYLKKRPTSSGSGRLGIVLQADWLTGHAAVVIAPP